MRTWLLAALLAWPACARAGAPRAALLAVPAEDFTQWQALAGMLAGNADLRLTLAVTPDMLSPQAVEALKPLAGRLELAMRLPGDPILPAAHRDPDAPRAEDTQERLALCAQRFRELLGAEPAGFVPGGGAVLADMAPAFQSAGAAWVAAGAAGGASYGPASGSPAYVDFAALRAAARAPAAADLEAAAGAADPAWIVLDEASGLAPPGSLLPLLEELSRGRTARRWQTVGETLEAGRVPAAPADRPGWAAGSWSGLPAQDAAWKAYGRAADTLNRYQNSGSADLKTLETATNALYAAQASRFYLALGREGSEAAAADKRLRQALMAVYRKLKQPVPGGLYASLLGDRTPAGYAAEEASTDIRTEQGADW
ncbi:MAG: hypothetical protein PHF00_13220, partial [Elusimicrobia bacterium]|nr:hypothetical protein [Elusimicrobiota bacterium]